MGSAPETDRPGSDGAGRFDLPGVHALNFVLHESLGGGTSSLRLDTQAKTYAQLLLAIAVPVPEGWSNELGAPVTLRHNS